jgi:hypothetical protein
LHSLSLDLFELLQSLLPLLWGQLIQHGALFGRQADGLRKGQLRDAQSAQRDRRATGRSKAHPPDS